MADEQTTVPLPHLVPLNWMCRCILALFLVYVLSPAPVLKAVYSDLVDSPVLAIYRPINTASLRWRPVAKFYRWYYDLWGIHNRPYYF